MKYEITVEIDQLLEPTVKELRSVDAAFKWMEGLKAFDLYEGELEEVGSVYKMVFDNKGKEQVMFETILSFNPPKEITMLYEMGGVKNECINLFIEQDGKTYYRMITSFKFPFVMRLFMWMFKPMFKKQTLKSMIAFKEYVENTKE